MKTINYSLILSAFLFNLSGCGGGGSDSSDSSQVYSLSVTDINLVRTTDNQAISINGLPAKGADITVE